MNKIKNNCITVNVKLFLTFTIIMILSICAGCSARTAQAGAGNTNGNLKIVATSPAVVSICERLDLDLCGVPASSLYETPERYKDARVVGAPMAPDMEILADIAPDYILSPVSLKDDLEPKYKNIGAKYVFINLNSVPSMYKSIEGLGELFNRKTEADGLVNDFKAFYDDYAVRHEGKDGPTVLILMRLPGSYVIATEHSYVGSLVELAGGKNVYAGTDKEFLNVNTEDMLQKNPDVILRTAHALPDEVMQMFADDFRENDIWQHFSAVENGRVYDLPYDSFGMSAKFNYKEALELLDEILYE